MKEDDNAMQGDCFASMEVALGCVYIPELCFYTRILVSACQKSLFSPLSKFSELYKSSENLGFQWRRTPFLGFPRTPFLTVAENLPLYRQSPYIASAQKKCGSRRPRSRIFAYPNVRSGWGRVEHFPRIYFCTKLKNLPLFFLLQLLQKMKCGQKSC